ncbi:MAG TPA: VCBS repeat-containing protein [Haliangiales bacterium]|nr:VCBS repeat-containing protein [Haliangiales bacterium]
MHLRRIVYLCVVAAGCSGGGDAPDAGSSVDGPIVPTPDAPVVPPLPKPTCAPGSGGTASAQAPVLATMLTGVTDESWLGSPSVVDLDNDTISDIVVTRDTKLVVWRPGGTVKWQRTPGTGRIWASPVVADFTGDARLEVVVASRDQIVMYDADGGVVAGWPKAWRDEVRAVAAGDIDGDGRPEIIAVTTTPLEGNGQRDIIQAFKANGDVVAGYPPNTTGTSGCDSTCQVTGGFDQTLAVGRLDGDTKWDILAPQDNAYMSWHQGSGVAYDVAPIFQGRTKVPGIRFLLDYAESKAGVPSNEATSLQAHFTNSAPAIADVDGNGQNDIVVLSSVQNAAQTDRKKGTALWVLTRDGTRTPGFEAPFYVSQYVAGLEDLGNNIVAETQQVTVADLDPDSPGLEMVFAAFDGRIHAVRANGTEWWSYKFSGATNVLTGGVLVADLSRDGVPEIVFATYSTATAQSALYVLDARGQLEHRVDLPGRGAMAVPTIADVDRNGTLDIVVSLKDASGQAAAYVYSVPGSATGCLLWPTGRANDQRNGFFRQP